MTDHRTATREEWRAEHEKLLQREKELAERSTELTKERRNLPWVRVEREYTFATDEGTKTLAELFDGRSQLVVYHIMFGPDWTVACPVCSALADHFDAMVPHLNARDVTLVGMSHAPIEKLQAYKRRLGWKFPYVSSFDTDFNFDFDASFKGETQQKIKEEVLEKFSESESIVEAAESCGIDLEEYVTTEGPRLNVFALEDGVVHHTYTTQELAFLMTYAQLQERAPKEEEDGFPIRRHDEYDRTGKT